MAPIDFDLRQLEIFRKVVDLESFSKAAQEVHLAQASVSERISNLEQAVGARLLDRLGRQVVPTRAGELMYKHATLLLEMKRTACLEMEYFLGLEQGDVLIGGSTIPGNYILPKVMGDFHQKYPAVSVMLTIADTGKIREMILAGEIELGIVGSKSPEKNLTHHHLWKDELVLAVPVGHPWAKKRAVSLKDLSKEPMILRASGSGTLKITEDYLRSKGLKGLESFNVVARLGTSTAVKEGIKAGLGLSIISIRALETELNAGILKALKIRDLPMSRIFYLVRDKRRMTSPLCQALIGFLKSTAELD
jgi:DNA-binding transcriptional LysR family regulator